MIQLYTMHHCEKCHVLKEKLREAGFGYTEITDEEAMNKKGIHSVPVLEVDGSLLSYYEAVKWVNERAGL